MRPAPPSQPSVERHRRIGRKALQADKITTRLLGIEQKKAKKVWRLPTFKRRVVAAACALVIVVSAVTLTGVRHYNAQASASQQAWASKQQIELKEKSVAADACRREKAAKKADLIGKITYDELYDYGECDR